MMFTQKGGDNMYKKIWCKRTN